MSRPQASLGPEVGQTGEGNSPPPIGLEDRRAVIPAVRSERPVGGPPPQMSLDADVMGHHDVVADAWEIVGKPRRGPAPLRRSYRAPKPVRMVLTVR